MSGFEAVFGKSWRFEAESGVSERNTRVHKVTMKPKACNWKMRIEKKRKEERDKR